MVYTATSKLEFIFFCFCVAGLIPMTDDNPTEKPADADPVQDTDTFDYFKNEFHVMTSEKGFPTGNYTWYMKFSGSLLDGILGFYRSSYKTSAGEERYRT